MTRVVNQPCFLQELWRHPLAIGKSIQLLEVQDLVDGHAPGRLSAKTSFWKLANERGSASLKSGMLARPGSGALAFLTSG